MVVVGAASRDLNARDPRGWRLGGGVTYSSLALARLGLRVAALMGVDHQASQADELDFLRAAGVQISPVLLERGPVFDNREQSGRRKQVAHETADRVAVHALPEGWREPACLLLNPVAGELGDEWASIAPPTTLVGLGWQGLLRRLVPGRPVEALPIRALPLIARADLATLSVEDAAGGAGVAIRELLRRPGQQLVVTSDRGMSLHVSRHADRLRWRSVPVQPARSVRDPTGAGDVFLAAWVASVLAARAVGLPEHDWRPLQLAAAAAGAKVETASLAEMASLHALRSRLRPPIAPK